MNDDAADALRLLVDAPTPDVYPELDDQLREMLSREDQVLRLELGLRVANDVDRLVRSLSDPVPVRCIVGRDQRSRVKR
jgi:hypothetical protein